MRQEFQDASSHPVAVATFAFCAQRLSLQISLELFNTPTLAVFSVCGCADVYFSGGLCLQTQAYLLEGSPEWTQSLIKAIGPLNIYTKPLGVELGLLWAGRNLC